MQERKNTILIVDDEPQILKMLTIYLETLDYKVIQSETGKEAVRLAASVKPDLVLLDLGLPDMDGKDVVANIRGWSQVPIVILSVRSDDQEIVKALNHGADDYITKPFNADVLIARINANLRKSAIREAGEPELVNGNIRMDLVRHQVFINDKKVPFTPKEYELLRYFLTHRGKMLTHRQLLKEIWGAAHVEDTQYLRVYVGQVRDKLQKHDTQNNYILTEPGIGYRMDDFQNAPSDDAEKAKASLKIVDIDAA